MGSIRKGRTAQAPTTSHVGQTLAMGGGGGAYLPSPAPSLPGEPALPPSPSPPPPHRPAQGRFWWAIVVK